MEIKIGITHLNRELALDVETSASEVERQVREALTGDGAVLTLVDSKHRTVLVPAQHIAYIELGSEASRQVGFGPL